MTHLARFSRPLVLLATLSCVSSCSSSPGERSVDAGATADATTTADAVAAASDCQGWCDSRALKEDRDGFCAVDVWGTPDTPCVEACEAGLDPDTNDALQACIEDDALCFQSLEQCMGGIEGRFNCEQWCEYRAAEHATDGFCEPSLQESPATECVGVCIAALYRELSPSGVQACIKDDPLCFVEVLSCAGPLKKNPAGLAGRRGE